jgi:hypothetical protein
VIRNRFTQHSKHEVNLVSFRDLTSAIIGLLLGLIALVMIYMNPAAKKASTDGERAAGSVRVEIVWPPQMDVDIDLWCMAPGDVPVGYSNKGGLIFNLVRDDLGSYMDKTGINYEVMFSRGAPPGEYICNVHWYGNSSGVKEVPVTMVVTYRASDDPSKLSNSDKVIEATATLYRQGEELTMARWRIDSEKKVVPGSIHRVQHPLREYKKAQ